MIASHLRRCAVKPLRTSAFKLSSARYFGTYPSKQVDSIPSLTLKARKDGDWDDIETDKFFSGKRVVVFSLPGAFTPTCSSTHLPRYEELAADIKAEGVDDIVCMSVNDGFVMEAWGKDQGVVQVKLFPDGNGEFSEHMGMLVDKSPIGFGNRSWRYSMVVNDKKVEKMFAEPNQEGDPFEVSDADTMLQYLKSAK